ncbi:MAG: CHASE2 domain-containing protein [Cyanobacteria bacterium P01_D01_bin.105]
MILPGMLVVALVCIARLSGLLQVQEWMALDTFARSCPPHAAPDRIAVVSISESDYQAIGEYPLSAEVISQALIRLQQYRPRVIGLDIFKDFPAILSETPLSETIQSMPNVVVAERAFSSKESMNVTPPSNIAPDQIGFVDLEADTDGELRRTVLAAVGENGEIKYSLAVQLTRKYLATEGLDFNLGATPTEPIEFEGHTLPKFFPNTGGYIRANVNNNQALIHFCALQRPYETVALPDLLAGNVDADRFRDVIVIIGNVASSVQDTFITSAVRETLYSRQLLGNISEPTTRKTATTKLIYGVEIHALTVKQLLSSVIDEPCFLRALPDVGEYYWIVLWGLVGMTLSVLFQSPWKTVVGLVVAALVLTGLCYWLMLRNWWLPVVPAGLSLWGAGLVTAFFDRDMRAELAQRKAAVERTYEAIHNGPLQRLAAILRSLDRLSPSQIHRQLQDFNDEIRTVFERMRENSDTRGERLYLANNTMLSLQMPLSDLLYSVYEDTIAQPLPGFSSVQTFLSPDFNCLSQNRFSLECKRGFCLFLQEALTNVGKYAVEATMVDVSCTLEGDWYRLSIIDNGLGITEETVAENLKTGEGTRQAIALAHRLRGRFRRLPSATEVRGATGTLCEIMWPKKH